MREPIYVGAPCRGMWLFDDASAWECPCGATRPEDCKTETADIAIADPNEPDRTPRTRKALDAVAANRTNDPGRPWTHHDPLIEECVKLELDRAELLAALQALLNATMHKNHPMESDMAIAAIKMASK